MSFKPDNFKQKITVSTNGFWIYIQYLILILLLESNNLLNFIFKKNNSFINYIIIICFWIIFVFWGTLIRKNIHSNFSHKKIFCLIIIFIFGFIKSCYPDMAYDTNNYHIIAQADSFKNWFDKPYFALGNFQVWGFRLGDQCFRLARNMLGYRMGTLLNTFVLMISYLQICQIWDLFTISTVNKTSKQNFLDSIIHPYCMALFVVLCHESVMILGSYYVDLLGLPIALECIYIFFKHYNKSIGSHDFFYYAFLNGIWLALKLTNIVFIIPVVITYIWNHRREISASVFGKSVLFASFPSSIYMIYNFICTGNPVFPYFNSIFRSPYFRNGNWSDKRWGGENITEKIFWLLNLVFKPEYRLSEIPNKNTFILVLGFFTCCCLLIFAALKHIQDKRILYFINIILISSVIWGITTGYERYFLVGMIYLGIISIFSVFYFLSKHKIWSNFVACILFVSMLMTCLIETQDVFDGYDWSGRKVTTGSWVKNLPFLFKDHKLIDPEMSQTIDVFYLTDLANQQYAYLYDSDTIIINRTYINKVDEKIKKDTEKWIEQLKTENICDIKPRRDLVNITDYVLQLNNLGIEIVNMDLLNSNITPCVLINYNLNSENKNACYILEDSLNFESCINQFGNKISFFVGRYFEEECNEWILEIYYKKNGDKELLTQRIINGNRIGYYEIDLPQIVNGTDLIWEAHLLYNDELITENNHYNKIFIINPKIYQS